MAYDEALAARIEAVLAGRDGFTQRKMFGGVGHMLDGNMCVGVWKDGLILRLAAEDADAALREPHVRVFDIAGPADDRLGARRPGRDGDRRGAARVGRPRRRLRVDHAAEVGAGLARPRR